MNSSDTTVPTTAPDGPGLFQCGTCKRQYKRVDHLARHVRSHTKSKPYQCRVCPKVFARADLLKRHAASHDSPSGRNKRPLSPSAGNAPGRVTQACRSCASNHLRCTERKPCHRCTDKGIECVWDRSAEFAFTPPSTVAETVECARGSPNFLLEAHELPSESPDLGGLGGLAGPPIAHPLPHQPSVGPHDLNLPSGQWTPMGALDFNIGMNIELDDIDLRFLEAYNMNVPFELGAYPGDESMEEPRSADPCQPAAICTEAFRSYWVFRPNAQDHGSAEEHNLSLPSASHNHASPESRIPPGRRITCAKLSVAARDKILTSVVQNCRPENLARAVESFPSVELLDALLQYYLASPVARSDTFLHAATFDPNTKRPELLAAMAAGGAVLTSDPVLSKLGLAIQEYLRVAVPKHWERDNSLIRDLQLSQAFIITLEIGLWSGRSRKVEIAESFLQPLLTMLRRDGKFRRSRYSKIVVPDCDDTASLRPAWEKWVEQESMKRLAFRMIQHDTSASMALLVNPLVSYAEILLPFPDSYDLWSAGTPEQWKTSFSSQANSASDQAQTLADYLDNPEVFNAHRNAVDMTVVTSAFLSCAWSLSWEHIQLSALQRVCPRRWNALILSSRHDEILKLLNAFRLSTDPDISPSSSSHPCAHEATMRLNLNLVHLHAPFEHIQFFAGMEGPEQARLVYPAVRDWAVSEAARTAVWHAGQVVRAARRLPDAAVWGLPAIMVYQAGLALWAYGLLAENTAAAGGAEVEAAVRPEGVVYLDGPDGIAVQRFTQLGTGYPCIRGSPGSDGGPEVDVYLSQPVRVLAAVMRVLRENHEGMSRPHLVDNLIQLMGGLQSASGSPGMVS